jgi:lipopolysaccharide export system protein LptA
MKFFIILLLAGSGVCLRAQTNRPVASTPPAETVITSDSGRFNGLTHQMFYNGHVVVIDPKAKLWCESLTVNLPAEGGRPTNIVAITNVVIDTLDNKGQTNHITADKAVYVYGVVGVVTNETITFTGGKPSPKVENPQFTIYGEPLVLDLVTKQYGGSNYRMIFKQTSGAGGGTNASPFNILK